MSEFPFRYVHFSAKALGELPPTVRSSLRPYTNVDSPINEEETRSLIVSVASEILTSKMTLPSWRDASTLYLVLADAPEPTLFQLPTVLRIHKPDQRIHVTRDRFALKRQAIALTRSQVVEGIVDAYLFGGFLYVVTGDLSIRRFAVKDLSYLSDLDQQELSSFEIHVSGSYLHWHRGDLRIGVSQMLQAVDPMYLADVAIERYSLEKVSLALRQLREERGLTQAEIGGLSDRHVRRLENEEVRLSHEAAAKYAMAFGFSLDDFLTAFGERLASLRDDPDMTGEERLSGDKSQHRHVS
jgi:DNA-binding XRE family transcriptional regulator